MNSFFIPFLLIATYFGEVYGGTCSEDEVLNCITTTELSIKALIHEYDKCSIVGTLFECLIQVSCPPDKALKATETLRQQFNCQDHKDAESEKCRIGQTECGSKIDNLTLTEKVIICQNLMEYKQCLTGKCPFATISRKMTVYTKQVGIAGCSNIPETICGNAPLMEDCLATYGKALDIFQLREHDGECQISEGLSRCLSKDAECPPESVYNAIEGMVKNKDCFEEIDVCDVEKKEACIINFGTSDNCQGLLMLSSCLKTNASCHQHNIRLAMRKILTDRKMECAEINDCNLVKEENCHLDYSLVNKNATIDSCVTMNNFKECLSSAKCNKKYFETRVTKAASELLNPCVSVPSINSSITHHNSSIGLLLLLLTIVTLANKYE